LFVCFLVENVELNYDEFPLAFQTKWTDLHTYRFELKSKVDAYIVVSKNTCMNLNEIIKFCTIYA